jgi:hypothetical protein
MIIIDRPAKKQAVLSRALDLRIRKSAPRAVVSWAQDHLRLPDSDLRRMKKLYDKVMHETITPDESAELDGLLDACAAMDLLRARLVIGATDRRKPNST